MAARSRSVQRLASTSANLGFARKLWEAADTLRGIMDAAEYQQLLIVMLASYGGRVYDPYRGSGPILTSGEVP